MKMSALVLLIAVSVQSHAAPQIKVRCQSPAKKNQFVVLTLDATSRKIVQAGPNNYVSSDNDPSSPFSFLSGNLDESPFENIRSIKAPNSYSMVSFITTADAITVGVSADLNRGFYHYKDLGSGNGDAKMELACAVVKK